MDFDLFWLLGAAVPSLVNGVTKHFSQYKGIVKAISFVTEIFSFWCSSKVGNGLGGKLKFPLTSVRPTEDPWNEL